MSVTTGGTAPSTTAPVITKNAFFSYVTVSGKQQREVNQVWTVTAKGKTLTIYLQGDVTGKGFTRDATYFAKKHLITFAGGKAAAAGGASDGKMQRITAKRQKIKVTKSQAKGNTAMDPAMQKLTDKYSITPAKNGSTMIFCDALGVDRLQEIFAEALLAGTGGEAELELPAEAVWFCPDGSATPQLPAGVAKGDTVVVPVGYEKSGTGEAYLVYHLHGDKVHKL